MRKTIVGVIFIFFYVITGLGQDAIKTEYGKPTELKGLTKIFVDTEGDTEERERIIKEFDKAKVEGISFLDDAAGAEIILSFVGGTYKKTFGNVSNGVGSMNTKLRSTGVGIAFIPKEPNVRRIILSVKDTKETALDKKPSVKFARELLKLTS